jgi:hypothetical protein
MCKKMRKIKKKDLTSIRKYDIIMEILGKVMDDDLIIIDGYYHDKWSLKTPCPNSGLRRLYGISGRTYNRMRQQQKGKCAICGKSAEEIGKRLTVDHDHKTGKVRGLLCGMCNSALGFAKDSTEVLGAAIKYLKENGNDSQGR